MFTSFLESRWCFPIIVYVVFPRGEKEWLVRTQTVRSISSKQDTHMSPSRYDPAAPDAYALGLLLHSVFNPDQPVPETSQPPHSPPTAASRGSIPISVFNAYKKLLNPNPKNRLNTKGFLDLGMAETGFFATNRLVRVCLGLENFSIESEAEKNALLK